MVATVGIEHVRVSQPSWPSVLSVSRLLGVLMTFSLTCGTHFGETKEPASIVVSPVFASLSTSSIFVANDIVCLSFCSPSRGPTSTMRTVSEWLEAAEANVLR
jgi:hypothetical protein